MKIKHICGNASLFDGLPDNVIAVGNSPALAFTKETLSTYTGPIYAMRSVEPEETTDTSVTEPVWTYEDREHGIYPKVGTKVRVYCPTVLLQQHGYTDWQNGDLVTVVQINTTGIVVAHPTSQTLEFATLTVSYLVPDDMQDRATKLAITLLNVHGHAVSHASLEIATLICRDFLLGRLKE